MKAIIISLILAMPCLALETGIASHYSANSGKKTANGERFDPNTYTAAHKTLKFGTKVRVTNLKNNKSIIVRINNRGPFVKGRIIDLTARGAKELDFYSKGLTRVKIEVIK